jgi:hypothetical protein
MPPTRTGLGGPVMVPNPTGPGVPRAIVGVALLLVHLGRVAMGGNGAGYGNGILVV